MHRNGSLRRVGAQSVGEKAGTAARMSEREMRATFPGRRCEASHQLEASDDPVSAAHHAASASCYAAHGKRDHHSPESPAPHTCSPSAAAKASSLARSEAPFEGASMRGSSAERALRASSSMSMALTGPTAEAVTDSER